MYSILYPAVKRGVRRFFLTPSTTSLVTGNISLNNKIMETTTIYKIKSVPLEEEL